MICGQTFVNVEKVTTPLKLQCPYCGHALQPVKDRKHFGKHKCINDNCSFYKRNLKKLPADLPMFERWKYKLRYVYREFTVNFFDMVLNQLPKWSTFFKFKKNNAHTMGLCLIYRVNLGLIAKPEKASQPCLLRTSDSFTCNFYVSIQCILKTLEFP